MATDKNQLDHVYWLGGSPCAGKSSIADLLAEAYQLRCYHIDDMMRQHQGQMIETTYPCLYKWTHTSWNVLWMQSPEQLFAEVVTCYREQFKLILPDLVAMRSAKQPVLVEGNSLMPDCVVEVVPEVQQAVWLVPTETFQREMYRQRGDWVENILTECDVPDLAYQHWMDRDVAFARWIQKRTTALNLPFIEVSGQYSIMENAEFVATSLGLR